MSASIMAKESKEKPKKRHHFRSLMIAVAGISVFTIHVVMAKGSTSFITNLLHGDFISIANLFMTLFVLTGWFLVYKYLGKLL